MTWIGKCASYMQKHMPVFAGVGVAAAVALSLMPQTVFLQRYRKVLAHTGTKGDDEMPIDPHTKSLIQKVSERMLLKAEEEVDLQFFTCFASEPLHKGSLKMKFGAIIGLPGTFAYKDVSDVNKDELLIDNRSVDWDSERGETLLKTLVLSDKAKAFAIARQINYTRSHHLHVQTVLCSLFGVLAYTSGFLLNRFFKFNQRLRPWARLSMYSFIASVWFVLYVISADTYQCWRDNSADRKAATLNKLYAEGGVEYYTKLLARNQVVRTMMGSEGPKKYTAYGNVVSTWRRDHVQLTTRRDNVQSYLREFENS